MRSNYFIYRQQCLHQTNPRGIGKNPVFSWKLQDSRKNVFQVSYQIIVKNESEIVWDSGIVENENTRNIAYAGPQLSNGITYQWQVTSRNNYGEEAVSDWAEFSCAMLSVDFWKAKWIQAARERKPLTDCTDFGALMSGAVGGLEHPEEVLDSPVYFRKEFISCKHVKSAAAYVTARGIYDFLIDGKSIGNRLAPEYTAYKKHIEFQSYDLTEQLNKKGTHAVGAILADGWYTGKIGLLGIGNQYGEENALLFQIHIEYEDGTQEDIVSDETVKWNYGAYCYADLYAGECVDFSAEPVGFCEAGFNDEGWKAAETVDYGYENLTAQSTEPVMILREIKPKLLRTPKGETVLDAGEDICGFTMFETDTKPGIEITLEHSEVLDQEGNFFQNIVGQHKNQKDRILPKETRTKYLPKFTFHGFRYVKVTGLQEVNPDDFTICVIGSRMDKTGSFTCSDDRINQLMKNIYRSQEGNMVCIPTDCPQREREGWTGDAQVYAQSACFHMDVQSFMERWLYDMRLEQLPDGQIPHVVPDLESNKLLNGGNGTHESSAGWGDVCVILPYAMYQFYADETILRDNYPMMKHWMQYVEENAGESLCDWGKLFHFGDWLIPSIMSETGNPVETAIRTKEEAAMAMFAYTTDLMSEIAAILGELEDVDYYMKLNQRIRQNFSREFVDGKGKMRQPLQGLYVLAIYFHLLSEEQKAGAIQELCRLIHDAGDTLDTGFISVPFLLDTLWENGQKELAYRLLYQEKAPSWLYEVKNGATTIWEKWVSILPDGTRTCTSYNHFAFGCVSDFICRKIGGLNIEEPGCKKIRIQPDFDCGLRFAKISFDSIYGKIAVEWEKENTLIKMRVELPPNTSGHIVYRDKNLEVGNGIYEFEFDRP